MSLIEDAKRLSDGPFPMDDQGYCLICGGTNLFKDHKPDCPWLSMPRIVAALEAAERVAQARAANDVRVLVYEAGRLAAILNGADGVAGESE